ncbi:hypothetical protein Tco_1129747 [Tanacetum coccineum]
MSPSSNSNVLVVNVNYGGIFLKNPLTYSLDCSYQLSNYDEEISDSPSLDDEHDDVGNDDDDENVDFTTLNQTSNDRFLSLLCYDDISSNDAEDEVSFDENWSANEEGDDRMRNLLNMVLCILATILPLVGKR